jgi:hypothetical protein
MRPLVGRVARHYRKPARQASSEMGERGDSNPRPPGPQPAEGASVVEVFRPLMASCRISHSPACPTDRRSAIGGGAALVSEISVRRRASARVFVSPSRVPGCRTGPSERLINRPRTLPTFNPLILHALSEASPAVGRLRGEQRELPRAGGPVRGHGRWLVAPRSRAASHASIESRRKRTARPRRMCGRRPARTSR